MNGGERPWRARAVAALLAIAVLVLVRCASVPPAAARRERTPESVEVCGEPFPIGTRVVSWREPGGYDAYREAKFFTDEEPPDGRRRYSPLRGSLPEAVRAQAATRGVPLAELQRAVRLFVLHYDAAGTSRQCFKVLHDVRFLSVHFLLDVDGTIYQTLDLRESAWHATVANDAAVGVEIAHPGAWRQPMNADMARWYGRDEQGWFMKTPAWMQPLGIRTPGFVARPDRPDVVAGPIHGATWHQLDFTTAQYEALAKLCAGLARVFPRLRLDVPRRADGAVLDTALPQDQLATFAGIVGHFHVQTDKQDPGPAFQWERLLRDARALAAAR
jgi:N-acetylmuramoyl-L-alanine amidase